MNATNSEAQVEPGRDPQENETLSIEELVQNFRVCWEVYKEQAVVNGRIREIGFELDLFGTHEPGVGHVAPGCEQCRRVQSALRRIAERIVPHEERPSRYEVSIEGQSLTYSSRRRNRPDVSLTIRIVHRSGFEEPINECEVRCLTEMQHALSELGACKSAWSPLRRVPTDASRVAS